MLKKAIAGIAIIAALWGVARHRDTLPPSENEIIIGIILPLSGGFANAGEGLKNAALMAVDDLNSQAKKYRYRLLIDNDGFEAKRTAVIFSKHLNVDGVSAEISFASQSGKLIAPQAEAHRLLHLNFGASDPLVTEGRYNFVHWTAPEQTTTEMLDFYRRRQFKNIAVVAANNAGTLSLEEVFRQKLVEYDGMKATFFHVQPDEKDFRMLWEKVKQTHPDVVLGLVYGDSIYPFVKQYREAGLNVPLTNLEAFTMLDDMRTAEGVYIADVAKADASFMKRFSAAYPGSSVFAVGNIYDAVMLIGKAFETAERKEDAVAVLNRLETYTGVVGKLRQNEDGFFGAPAVLEKVEDGRLVVIEK